MVISLHERDLSDFFLEHGIRNFIFLTDLYVDGVTDTANYHAIYDKIIELVKIHKTVALLVEGHPRIGVTIVQWMAERESELPFKIEILEGISSFDTMINDLAIDPLERGTALLDANRLILFDITLDPE